MTSGRAKPFTKLSMLFSVLSLLITPSLLASRALGTSGILHYLPSSVCILSVITMAMVRFGQGSRRSDTLISLPVASVVIYIFVLIVSIVRIYHYGDVLEVQQFDIVMIISYSINVVMISANVGSENRGSVIKCILLSVPVLGVFNFFLDVSEGNFFKYVDMYLNGVRVTETALIGGANTNAIIYGLALVVAVYYFVDTVGTKKIIHVIPLLVSLFYLLSTRSQGMMISSVIAIGCIFFEKYVTRYVFNILLVYWIFSAKIQIELYSLVENSDFRGLLERAGAGLGVGSGRTYFWEKAISILDVPSFGFFFGNGYFGALKTSLVSEFSYVFNVDTVYEIAGIAVSLHNASLQYQYECGVVGVLIFVWVISNTFKRSRIIGRDFKDFFVSSLC